MLRESKRLSIYASRLPEPLARKTYSQFGSVKKLAGFQKRLFWFHSGFYWWSAPTISLVLGISPAWADGELECCVKWWLPRNPGNCKLLAADARRGIHRVPVINSSPVIMMRLALVRTLEYSWQWTKNSQSNVWDRPRETTGPIAAKASRKQELLPFYGPAYVHVWNLQPGYLSWTCPKRITNICSRWDYFFSVRNSKNGII